MERFQEQSKITLGDQTEWQEKNLEHLRYEYDLKPEDYVFDLGSYRREWAKGIEEKYGCNVICFDPLENHAAWILDGELEMGGQYYYTSKFDTGQLGPIQKFKCVDISTWINTEIALMKINIEGGEYEVLSHLMFNDKMKYIKYLQVQFHKIEGRNSEKEYEMMAIGLSKTHKLEWRYPFVWESWERL